MQKINFFHNLFGLLLLLFQRWRKAAQAAEARQELGQGDKFVMTHTGSAIVLSNQSDDQKKKKQQQKKICAVPHSTTFVLCYTVFFCHLSLVCKLCETNILLETVLARGAETHLCSFSMYISVSVMPANQNYMTLTVTAALMGQLHGRKKM